MGPSMSVDTDLGTSLRYRFGDRVYDFSSRTHLMGVLNVTPDSFSDGGHFFDQDRAVERGEQMVTDGADFIDVGGESTRPGSDPVPLDEELRRVIPVIRRLTKRLPVPVSIDTYKPEVARAALDEGASIVNDITALTSSPEMGELIADRKASVILMHMQGTPRTMQKNPTYDDVVDDVISFLRSRIRIARDLGIRQVVADPGIGFGKTLEHNLELLKRLDEFGNLDVPVLIGVSRKSFLGAILDLPAAERIEGTAAAVTASILKGASVIRVHDVKEMKRVALVADALRRN